MQRKPRKKATPSKAGASIPVIPAMRGFSFLTGDANWKEYGGTFYRSFGDGTYALIEFVNLRDAVSYGNIRGNKYAVVGRTVDLSPGGFSLRNLDSALRTIGASPATRNPKVILDAVNVYGAFDVDFEIFGNNADKLMADAKRRY